MRRLVLGVLILFALSSPAFAAGRAAAGDTAESGRICQSTGTKLAACCCEPKNDALVCTLTGQEVDGCCCVPSEGETPMQKAPSASGPESCC